MQTSAIAQQRALVASTTQRINLAQKKAGVGGITGLRYRLEKPRSEIVAQVFGGPEGEKKTLKREEEPDEYWTSEAERRGDSPFKDPLALIGIFAILFPFIFLGIAIATGLVDLNGGR